jgi:hypothetical protein
MGRSLSKVTPAVVRDLQLPGSFYSESLDRHYEVFARQGKLFQSEYQSGPGGEEIFRNTHEIDWIVGANANGFSTLVQRGSYLFEAPLSFYVKPQQWELSPGFENTDLGFNRPILGGCISCHSGRPNPADETSGKFKPVPFTHLAIGCENCHGPGGAHLRAMTLSPASSRGPQIVNPGRLSANLENDICMSCHEAGDSRVPKPGKTYQDFRPGTPLDDTLSILMVPLKRSDPDDTDHVRHFFEMSMSKCYRATAGQLRCATCHDPHVEPTHEEAPAYFNAKCVECHSSRTCTLAPAARRQTTPADNCIGCHMPQRKVPLTAHTSLTNHRILIRPGEPWPEEAFQQTTPSLPDLVHLNRVPGRSDDLPPLTLLEAYRRVAEKRPEYNAAYQKTLSELERTEPNNAVVQQALGRRDLANGELQQAIDHLQRAAQLDPQQATTYSYLSEALAQQNRIGEAIEASEQAVSLQPYDALIQKALIDRLIADKQYSKAIAAMDHYLELFPEDSFMRRMLEIAKQ